MDINCRSETQLTLTLDNRPGILADLCAHLADHRINLRAMATFDHDNEGSVRLVVDQPQQTRESLDDAGVSFSEQQVLAVEMANHPGSFAQVAKVLSLAGINISYIYASSSSSEDRALGIFAVSDLDRALALDWTT